jgi:hypothetical protein
VFPGLAVAADALARRWRVLLPVVVVLFLVGVPGNIAAIRPTGKDRAVLGDRPVIVALALSPLAREVPRSFHPDPSEAREVTVGWLLDAAADGRIPKQTISPRLRAAAILDLAFDQTHEEVRGADCLQVRQPIVRTLARGDVLVFRQGTLAAQVPMGERLSQARLFQPPSLLGGGYTLHVEGPVTVTLSRGPGTGHLTLCRGA